MNSKGGWCPPAASQAEAGGKGEKDDGSDVVVMVVKVDVVVASWWKWSWKLAGAGNSGNEETHNGEEPRGGWHAKREALKQRPVRRSVQQPGGGAGTVSRS